MYLRQQKKDVRARSDASATRLTAPKNRRFVTPLAVKGRYSIHTQGGLTITVGGELVVGLLPPCIPTLTVECAQGSLDTKKDGSTIHSVSFDICFLFLYDSTGEEVLGNARSLPSSMHVSMLRRKRVFCAPPTQATDRLAFTSVESLPRPS